MLELADTTSLAHCMFEYVYFARPDSTIDEVTVYQTRLNIGKQLYEQFPIDADVIIPVPDSSIPAAIGYSRASGITYGEGLIKNRYVGRTFITPSQEIRERAVAVKLNPLKVNLEGKSIVLIDDSIVRGTTSKHLVDSLRKAGVKEINFLIASPGVKYPCYFGIDTPYRSELIAANHTVEEIRDMIGADYLGYLSEEGVKISCDGKEGLCMGCFNGIYPVATPVEKEE